jgi:hypothetical protein
MEIDSDILHACDAMQTRCDLFMDIMTLSSVLKCADMCLQDVLHDSQYANKP